MFEMWFDYVGWGGIFLALLNCFIAPFHTKRFLFVYVAVIAFLGPMVAALGQGIEGIDRPSNSVTATILMMVAQLGTPILGWMWLGVAKGEPNSDVFGFSR